MHNIRKSLMALMLVTMTISCTAQSEEVFVTANTNLCPNCFNQYRMLDSIDETITLHLVFQNSTTKEAKKFTDKFLHIKRDYDFICNDSLYASLSHNIFPWLYYYKENVLVFDANLNQNEEWKPIINRLHKHKFDNRLAQLPEELTLSEDSRCIPLKDKFLFMDFTYNELHLFDSEFRFLKTQDFADSDLSILYQNVFHDEKAWTDVNRYATEIKPYIPDFGRVKINNGCIFNDTLFMLINYY